MSIWKKVAGGAISAALLTSLLATTAFAALPAYRTTQYLSCTVGIVVEPSGCSQVSDGISTVTLTGLAGSVAPSGPVAVTISGGGTFASSDGVFTTVSTTLVTAPAGAVTGSNIVVRAPSAASTGTVTFSIADSHGTYVADGTLTITWTATSGLAISAANSSAKFVAKTDTTCTSSALASNTADKSTNAAAKLCVTVEDGNGNPVTNATVAVTITPVGLVKNGTVGAVAPAGTAQAASATANVAGVYAFGIGGSGLAGVATVGISITNSAGTTTVTLSPKTFTFTGAVASIVATGVHTVGLDNGSTTVTGGVTFTAKDSAGNAVATTSSTVVVTGTVLTSPADGDAVSSEATASTAGTVDYECGTTAGTATIAISSNSVTSNAITVHCSGAADNFTVAFDKTTVVPGGQATITLTVKDAAGNPAPDTTGNPGPYSVVVSSGAVLALSNGNIKNGIATWTFLAPFNTGVVTVLASGPSSLTTTSPQAASITVSTPQPVGAVVFQPTTSALGNTMTGPFTFATKIQSIGGFITWKVDGGSALAGKTLQVWVYKKFSATGTWAGPTMLTTRVANANGVAYINIHTGGILWLSLRPVLPATGTAAAVWGPTSIGRWR